MSKVINLFVQYSLLTAM